MMAIVSWDEFRNRWFNQKSIYIWETETSWHLWTYEENIYIKCIIEKKDNLEENLIFAERWFNTTRVNLIRVLDMREDAFEPMKTEKEDLEPLPETSEDDYYPPSDDVEVSVNG